MNCFFIYRMPYFSLLLRSLTRFMFWKTFNSIVVPLSILAPVIIGAYKYKILQSSFKIIWFYLLITAVINTGATITGRVFHINNSPITHVYTAIEMIMLIWFYRKLLEIKKSGNWFLILQIAFVLACIINAVFFQSIYTYCSYTRSIESMICMLFSLNYFAKIASSDKSILKDAGFYFNAGIFLYFSGAFMLFIFSNLITNLSLSDFLVVWSIHAALVLLMYLFFTFAFILCKK